MDCFKRSKTTLNFLTSRELGVETRVENYLETVSPQTSKLHITNFFLTSTTKVNVANCCFLKSGFHNNEILGVFNGFQFPGVTCELKFEFRPKCSKEENPPLVTNLHKIGAQYTIRPAVDACFYKTQLSDRNSVAYIMPHHEEGKSVVAFSWGQRDNEIDIEYIINAKVNSCAYNLHKNIFIAGTLSRLYIFDSLQFNSYRAIDFNPTSLGFDKSGNIIYIGDRDLGLHAHDMRANVFSSSVVHPGPVTEFKLLSDETKVVLSNLNRLKMVDLRMNKPIFDYQGQSHVVSAIFRNYVKIPFSLSEDVDILCSTNMDDITKLWSLSSGKHLYTIMPYVCDSNSRSCLVSNENQWGVALFQKNWMYILEP